MRKPIKYSLFLSLLVILTSCLNDNTETLLIRWEYQDSLANKIPYLEIISPSEGDSLRAPFTIQYIIKNWEIAPLGRHMSYSIDDEYAGDSFQSGTLIVSSIPDGLHTIKLTLAQPNGNLVPIEDEIQVVIKAPIPESFLLIVDFGSGTGNYKIGDTIIIEADAPWDGYRFSHWGGDSTFVQNPLKEIDTLIMPEQDVTISAIYDEIPISYNLDVKPIIQANCIACHSSDLDNPKYNSCEEVKARAALILVKIQDELDPMPPIGLMPQENIDLIKKWIEQGALCD